MNQNKGQVPISVLMSVYNTKEEYLREAIESILKQSFCDYEFIIVNDGSDEVTTRVLKSYCDSRIKVIDNEKNMGLTKSLNVGLAHAKGKYIARMDSDDISFPRRLEKQYQYMEKHHDIDILGAWTEKNGKIFKSGGAIPTEWRKVRMLFGNNGIVHSSAFIRKSFLDTKNLKYDENIPKAQDYKLWVDSINNGAKMYVLPCVLLKYRIYNEQISIACESEQEECVRYIREQLIRELYSEISKNEVLIFLKQTKADSGNILKNLIDNIEQANKNKNIYDSKVLYFELIDYYKIYKGEKYGVKIQYYLYRILRSVAKNGGNLWLH